MILSVLDARKTAENGKKQHEPGEFESFYLAFGGKLRSDNPWLRLAKLIPWEEIERRYAELFSETRGAPAISVRETGASLIIKEKLRLSDDETIEQIREEPIRENPYLQYLLGWRRIGTDSRSSRRWLVTTADAVVPRTMPMTTRTVHAAVNRTAR